MRPNVIKPTYLRKPAFLERGDEMGDGVSECGDRKRGGDGTLDVVSKDVVEPDGCK